METKSLPQTNSVHDCFNTLHRLASSLGFNLTVIVSRSRIYANIGHGFSINFDVDLIDAIPQIFVVFRGDVVIFPKAFFKIGFPAFIRRSGAFCQIFRFSRWGLLLNYAACRSSVVQEQEERTSGAARAIQITGTAFFKIRSIIDNLLG